MSQVKMLLTLSFILFAVFCAGCSGHGTLSEPPQRSSVWRDPRFAHLNPPPNYNDGGLWCDGIKQNYIPQQCGVCGDSANDPRPRPNEHGGTYGLGIMVANYTRGQVNI